MIVEGLTLESAIKEIEPIYHNGDKQFGLIEFNSHVPTFRSYAALMENPKKEDRLYNIITYRMIMERFLLDKESEYTRTLKEVIDSIRLQEEYANNPHYINLMMPMKQRLDRAMNQHLDATRTILDYFLGLVGKGLIRTEPVGSEGVITLEALRNAVQYGSDFGKKGTVNFEYTPGEGGLVVLIENVWKFLETDEVIGRIKSGDNKRSLAIFQDPDSDVVKIGYQIVPKSLQKPESFRTVVLYPKADAQELKS